ncbi:hypothetical protein OIU76_016663 [Salix suchowensis]|nr:hypothetical protein OIU76_016663 [Salix suchowensis]
MELEEETGRKRGVFVRERVIDEISMIMFICLSGDLRVLRRFLVCWVSRRRG